MPGINKTVVRNAGYIRTAASKIENHNERLTETYTNPDIIRSRSALNVHFKKNSQSYLNTVESLIEEGTVSGAGLRKDSKILDEFVFDVNSSYFDENGGYEFAKAFYSEAYSMAVKEAGSEELIVSAVMHADELNKGLSRELGRDVYHYHLHVVYVPVADVAVKDKSQPGGLRVIKNKISHSSKWPTSVTADEFGTKIIVSSYSGLQDRYFEHMSSAGFSGIERGEKKSTAEHLKTLDFKISKETERLKHLNFMIDSRMEKFVQLQNAANNMEKKLKKVDLILQNAVINKKGNVEMTSEDYEQLVKNARNGAAANEQTDILRTQIKSLRQQTEFLSSSKRELNEKTRSFLKALKLNPDKTNAAVERLVEQLLSERNFMKNKSRER